jgi:hypothetical protein
MLPHHEQILRIPSKNDFDVFIAMVLKKVGKKMTGNISVISDQGIENADGTFTIYSAGGPGFA